MAGPAILKIDVIADATKALQALGKVGDGGKQTGDKLSGLKSTMVGVFGTAAVVAFGKKSVDAALESQKATAALGVAFANTGDATGMAAKEAETYAAAMSKKTAIDDETIMAAQTQLASFHAVSSEVARGAGIFDRATAAAADMAASGLGSMDSNSISLGKALENPTKGIAALARGGTTFTKQQQDQIKAMQECGDLLGAQKLILQNVESQYKGTAEATATSSDKMTLAFGETQEAVGAALLPVLEELAPILQTVAGFIQDNTSWLVPLAGVILAAVAAWKVWNIVLGIWNVILSANPIGLVILAIGALIVAVIAIVKNWDKVKAALAAVFDWLKANWPLILAILTGPFGLAVLAIVRNWDTIKNAAKAVFDKIKEWATGAWTWIKTKFDAVADAVTGTFDSVKEAINGFIRGWNRLRIPSVTFDIPGGSFIPGVPDNVKIGGWDLPNLPLLQSGGSVLRTGMAVVHAGEQWSGVGRSFGGQTTINVHVATTGLGADAPQIQRAIVNALRAYTSRNGALDVPVRSVS